MWSGGRPRGSPCRGPQHDPPGPQTRSGLAAQSRGLRAPIASQVIRRERHAHTAETTRRRSTGCVTHANNQDPEPHTSCTSVTVRSRRPASGGRGGCQRRVVMSLHKLTAGDGYTYLTRQVAAHDADARGLQRPGRLLRPARRITGRVDGCWGYPPASFPRWRGDRGADDGAVRGGPAPGRRTRSRPTCWSRGTARRRSWRPAGWGRRSSVYEARQRVPGALRGGVRGAQRGAGCAAGLRRCQPRSGPRSAPRLAREMFAAEYGRDPSDARELSGFLARASRQATTAVAGYDLTFSPVKSVSALWALAPRRDRAGDRTCPPRRGRRHPVLAGGHTPPTPGSGGSGVAQVETTGLIAAAFTHRDSRAGDPDLHTHVAISNKVQSARDGRWLALGRAADLQERTSPPPSGTTPDWKRCCASGSGSGSPSAQAPRPGSGRCARSSASTRRLTGAVVAPAGRDRLPPRGTRRRSSRTDHGRPPTAVEAIALAQQANLETRQGKHEPRSLGEQRAAWRAEATTALGGAESLSRMLRDVLSSRTRPEPAAAGQRRVDRGDQPRPSWPGCRTAGRPGRSATCAPRPNASPGPRSCLPRRSRRNGR